MIVLSAVLAIASFGVVVAVLRSEDCAIDRSFALVLSVAILLSIAPLVTKSLGLVQVTYGEYDQLQVQQPTWTSSLDKVGFAAAAIIATLLAVPRINPKTIITAPPIAWLAIQVVGLIQVGNRSGTLIDYRWLALAVILTASCFVRDSRGAAVAATCFGLILAVATWLPIAWGRTSSYRLCRFDKCGDLGVLITGPYMNENALALALVASTGFAVFLRSRWLRTASVGLIGTTVALTGSRSALIGVAIAWTLVAIYSAVGPKAGLFASRLTVLASLALMFVIPMTAEPGDFTNRTALWDLAFGGSGWELMLGHGWDGLIQVFASSSVIPGASAYSLHNQLLDIFFVSGSVGVVLFIGTVTHLLRRSSQANGPVAAPLAVVLSVGVLEAPLSFGQVNWLSWTLVALALSVSVGERRKSSARSVSYRSSETVWR